MNDDINDNNNYLNKIYEKIINIKNREELYEIFDVKEKKEKFFYKKLIKCLENISIENEDIIINILTKINFYVKDKIFSIKEKKERKRIRKEAVKLFINKFPEINFISPEKIYFNYITCFQIKSDLFNYLLSNKNLSSLKNKINCTYFIKYFKLQDKYSFKYFNIIKNNNEIDYILITNLFNVYNCSEKHLINLYEFIISKIPKNSIPFIYIKKIFKNNKRNFNEEYKMLLIKNLLKFPEEISDDTYCDFFGFIYKNKLENYISNYNEKNFLNILVYKLKFKNCAYEIIRTFDCEKIKYLDKLLLKNILYLTDLEKIKNIEFLLEYLPEELNNIAYNYVKDEKIKYLKKLLKNINWQEKLNNEIIKEINKSNIKGFYIYKFKEYFNTRVDRLIEYVKNQDEYEIFISIFLSKIRKNNNNSIKKLSYILNYSKINNFIIPENLKYKYLDLINLAKNKIPYKFPEDKFGPMTDNCISYTMQDINVIFIQKCPELIKYFDLYFKNSEFIGIDSEWRESLEFNVKTKTAIMQLSDYQEKNILILDMIELINDSSFEENFEKLFINKKFISFGFKNDLIQLTDKLKVFFEKVKMFDITELYSSKYNMACPSFSKVCEKLFGKPLCKFEQCSNWEKRPLRKSQLHYAALDALLCCKIYKTLNENNN